MQHILLLALISNTVLYPVAAVPLVLAILTWILNLRSLRSPKVSGFVFNGSKWVNRLFTLFVAIIVVQIVGLYVPDYWVPTLFNKDGDNMGIYILLGFSLYTFICYFFIAFRPGNVLDIKAAKGAKQLALDLASSVGAGVGGVAGSAVAAGSGILAVIQAAAAPVFTVIGGATYMLVPTLTGFFTMLAVFIPIVAVVGFLGAFVILFVTFFTGIVVVVFCVLKFLANLRYQRLIH